VPLLLLRFLPYILGFLAVAGVIAGGVNYVSNNWATKAGIAKGRAEVTADWQAANIAAKKAADAKDEENRIAKEKADVQNAKQKRDLAGLYAAYASLRDQRRGSLLPQAASGAANPERTCFDRASLDRGMEAADGVLQRGAEKILLRGDTAIVDLETARKWAQKR
jgi:hypothetical protein